VHRCCRRGQPSTGPIRYAGESWLRARPIHDEQLLPPLRTGFALEAFIESAGHTTLYFNGKFRAQRTTGVQRVATELIRAYDACAAHASTRCVLLLPPGAATMPLQHIRQHHIGRPGLPLHLWEQAVLPWAARRGWLLSLSGSCPRWAPNQLALVHDAAVFDAPQGYSLAFLHWYRGLFRRLAAHARGLATVSAFSASRLSLHLGLPVSSLVIFRPGADHLGAIEADAGALDRWGLTPGRYLLTVASANPNKNTAALLRAWGKVQEPGMKLVLVGGQSPGVFRAGPGRIQERESDPRVVHAGAIDDASLLALYQHAVALVCPSLYEGFGLPVAEAMYAGCTVLAANSASLPETCGDAALLFDPMDDSALAVQIQQIVSDPRLRARLAAAGRARAAAWRWADTAQQLQTWLQRQGMVV